MKIILKIFGFISLGLAIMGIVVPVLPTTPFLLLSLYLFARSSKKHYDWLLQHRLFGNYIKDFKETRSITKGVKILSLLSLWTGILISAFVFLENRLYIQILLIIIAIGVSIHICKFKTK